MTTNLGQARIFGGVGSILLLLSFTPYAGGILGILGLILVLLAVRDIARYVNDRRIFNYMLTAVVLGIVGVAVGALVVFAAVYSFIGLSNVTTPGFNPATNLPPGDFVGLVVAIVLGLLAMWVLYLVSAIFIKRSFDTIAARLNVPMFRTAALLYLIGAALTVILVGFALIFVAQILFVVAFFSIPERATQGLPAVG